MTKKYTLILLLTLFANSGLAEITLLSKGIKHYTDGFVEAVGDENIMTLCVEGYVVLYKNMISDQILMYGKIL